MENKIKLNSSEFLGIDYLNRPVYFVQGEIHLKDNKAFTKHIAFFVNNEAKVMPLYEDIKRINQVELDDNISKENIVNLFRENYTPTLTKGTIEVIMLDKTNFISKTTVSDMPLNQEIEFKL